MTVAYGVCCVCGKEICPWDADRICHECDSEDSENDEDEESKLNKERARDAVHLLSRV